MKTHARTVWIADEDREAGRCLAEMLLRDGCGVMLFSSIAALIEQLGREQPDIVLLDLRPEMDGAAVLSRIQQINRDVHIVVMTAYPSVESAVATMKHGAFEYLSKPLPVDVLRRTVELAMEQRQI